MSFDILRLQLVWKELLRDLFMCNQILGTACNFKPFGSLPIYLTDLWFFFLLPCLLSLIVSLSLFFSFFVVDYSYFMLLLFCDNREWFINWKASCLGSNLSQWFSIILRMIMIGYKTLGFPGGSVVKNTPASVGDVLLISGSGRFPGKGNGNPLKYSCLGNPMDRGVGRGAVHGVAKESDMT